MSKVTINVGLRASTKTLTEFPMIVSDALADTPIAGQTTTYYCYASQKFPSTERCVILRDIMDTATGEIISITYMVGSSGSQFDFTCDWDDRLTGTFLAPNTQI